MANNNMLFAFNSFFLASFCLAVLGGMGTSVPALADAIAEHVNDSITFIELNLDPLPDVSSELHTTNGLPLHLMPSLKKAFDLGKPWFSEILTILNSDLLIYDMIQHWALVAASAMRIPFLLFIATSATMAANMFHLLEARYFFSGVKWWKNIVLVKSFKEIEVMEAMKFDFPIIAMPMHLDQPVNVRLVVEIGMGNATMAANMFHLYLKQDVSFLFDSNYYLKYEKKNVKEILKSLANGRKDKYHVMQGVKWFPKDENNMTIKEALLLGFVESVKTKVIEAMKFDVSILAMPMHLDQPVNARLVVEIGMGKEVVRNNKGVLMGAKVAEIMNEVVASNLGKNIRYKGEKISDDLESKEYEEIEFVMDELLQLCQSGHKL
ncbi:hypothetical protein Tco_0079254 [Tanacetum coccineum]